MDYSEEQREIIEDSEGNIVISAGAGAGKTRTLVEKIQNDLIHYGEKTYQIVAAITFTIKATNEIKTRLRVANNDEVYVSTNNQFVINEIIKPFCKDCYDDPALNNDFDTNYSEIFYTYDLCLDELKRNKKICSLRDKNQNFVFQLALIILQNSEIARRYLSAKYYKWYIDEYQDTDNDMHKFFMYVQEHLGIYLFIVGDEKQNIYSWRGANSQNFKALFNNEKFKLKRLTANFRSCRQIQNLSNLLNISTQTLIKDVAENNTKNVVIYCLDNAMSCIDVDVIINMVRQYNMHTAVLCRTNDTAKNICADLKENGLDFIYVPSTPIDDITCVNSWIYFGVAHYCLVDRNVYDFMEHIPVETSEKNDPLSKQIGDLLKDLYNYKYNVREFISSFEKLSELLGCVVEEGNILKVLKTIQDSNNELAFHNNDNYNQVTTIHKSKGQEFDLVLLFSQDFKYDSNEDHINELYVAITRAKNKLIIFQRNNNDQFIQYVDNKINGTKFEQKDFYCCLQVKQ